LRRKGWVENMAGILFIISAPSGSGKSTLVNELRRLVPELEFSVSYTTRAPRGSEKDGLEYHFVSRRQFEEMIHRGEFLEYAEVFGNYYGTARRYLQEAAARGQDMLLDIDVQGAAQVKSRVKEAVSIFVLPPSRNVLEKRLRNRSLSEGVAADEVIERRLLGAQKEIENSRDYDYILVNDVLDQSVDKLKAIVSSERARRSGRALTDQESHMVETARNCLQSNTATSLKVKEILASFAPAIRG
jgi:guanylate kinase